MTGMGGSSYKVNANAVAAPQITVTTDGGTTWQTKDGPPGYFTGLVAVPGLPGAYIAVAEQTTTPLVTGSYLTLDHGDTWTIIEQENAYNGAEFLAPDQGWAGLGKPSVDDTTPAIYKWTGGHVGFAEHDRNASLQVYPNPAQGGIVSLHLNDDLTGGRIILRDGLGRTVLTRQLPSDPATVIFLHLAELAAGTYVIEVLSTSTRQTAKLVLQ